MFIDQSCHIGMRSMSNGFDLNYLENALYRYSIYQKIEKKRDTIKSISQFSKNPNR